MSNELATVTNDLAASNESTVNAFMGGIFSSVQAETQEEKLEIYASISDCDDLKKQVNKVINVENVIIQQVELPNDDTGELEKANRIVLIDNKGKAYGCTSTGVETSIKNLFAVVGAAPWSPAIPLMPVMKQGRNGWEFMSLVYSPSK